MAARRPLVSVAGSLQELPAGDLVPVSALGSGTPDGTKFLRDDGVWATPAGGGSSGMYITVSGALSLDVGATTTLTITSFDSATTYVVSATGGTATISGATITYVAGATPGAHTITITGGSSTRVLPVTVTAVSLPTVVGTFFQGGYYAGRIVIGGSTYAILVAPKVGGEFNLAAQSAQTVNGVVSKNDGWTNTAYLTGASYPAAYACSTLVLNGYEDWYLPSRDELEICYRAFKPSATANSVVAKAYPLPGDTTANGYNVNSSPAGAAYTAGIPAQTAVAAFQTGGAQAFTAIQYMTSTEYNLSFVAAQLFSDGTQTVVVKTSANYSRAVRRVLVS